MMATPSPLCRTADSVLVLIDTQTRLMAAMPPGDRERLLRSASLLLRAAATLNIPVIHTEQYPRGLGQTEPALLPYIPATARYFEKVHFSCCGVEGFMGALQELGRDQVILAGVEAHVCVLQTAIGLHAPERRVFVVADGVCSRSPEHAANALARLQQAGIIVSNSESVLFEWLVHSRHEHFRTLSGLLR
jgi:nicotinamidase-related amidase